MLSLRRTKWFKCSPPTGSHSRRPTDTRFRGCLVWIDSSRSEPSIITFASPTALPKTTTTRGRAKSVSISSSQREFRIRMVASMKVLHIVKTAVGANWAYEQVRGLCLLGIEVVVALPSDTEGLAPKYRQAGATVVRANL